MSQRQPGRVDHLAQGIFERLLAKYGNPALKVTCHLVKKEIGECLEENLGPGTKAHQVGEKVADVVRRLA